MITAAPFGGWPLLSERVKETSRIAGMPMVATHIVRASLTPNLYRDIEIPSRRTLRDLAEAIVTAFGFEFDHAFGFYSNLTGNLFDSPRTYDVFADIDRAGTTQGVQQTRVIQAFPSVGQQMMFLFDYGNNWQFRVEVIGEGQKQPKIRYPRVLASVGEAPPQYPNEDDGG